MMLPFPFDNLAQPEYQIVHSKFCQIIIINAEFYSFAIFVFKRFCDIVYSACGKPKCATPENPQKLSSSQAGIGLKMKVGPFSFKVI